MVLSTDAFAKMQEEIEIAEEAMEEFDLIVL